MTARPTGAESGGPIRSLVAGCGTFVIVAAVAALWLRGSASPPWVAPGLFVVAGILALTVGILVYRTRFRGSDARSQAEEAARPLDPTRADAAGMPRALDRLQVDWRGRTRLLPTESIDWIEAEGNYIRLHAGKESFLYRMSLRSAVDSLDGSPFLRVHKSAAVNLDAVVEVDPMPTGDAMLRLTSGAEVRLSRRYAPQFHARTGRA